jgi:hypothetical protein
MTSLAIYLRYEHFGKSCSKRTCFFSDAELSATKIIKLEVFVTIILISGQSIHFFRILVLMYQHKWYGLQGELDQERIRYRQIHQQLMRSGFGMGYDFEMKRFGLNKGQYLMIQLEVLEERLVEKEERFNELHSYLGHQYCHDLEPSVVGFKRCVAHLLLE